MSLLRPLFVDIPVPGEGFSLSGRLDGPGGAPTAIVCHPHPAFGGSMDTPLVADLAVALVTAGMRVLRFNFRGVGGSGGRAEGGLVEERDVRAACAFMRERTGVVERGPIDETTRGPLPTALPATDSPPAERSAASTRARSIVLCGYSFGALMALKAIAGGEHVRRAAAIGLPTAIVGDDPARIADMTAALKAVPTLLIAGDTDQFCQPERLRTWASAAPGTEVEILPGVDHFPEGPKRARVVARVVEFITRAG